MGAKKAWFGRLRGGAKPFHLEGGTGSHLLLHLFFSFRPRLSEPSQT